MGHGRGGPRRRIPLQVAVAAATAMSVGYGGVSAADVSTSAPSPSADDVRTLKEGRTLPVAIAPNALFDIPASSAKVTLTKRDQADPLPQGEYLSPERAGPGMTYLCLEFKVSNTSDAKFDTSYLAKARWTGKDGEARNVSQVIGADCGELGLVKANFYTAPEPGPGEFVRATTVLMVPDAQPGFLEFADGEDHPMFKVTTTPSN